MKHLLALVMLNFSFPISAYAGYGEYVLLDISECNTYLISTDLGANNVSEEKQHQEAINKLEPPYLEALSTANDKNKKWGGIWGVRDENAGQVYFGLCKGESDRKTNKEKSFQCDGLSDFPLSGLDCKAESSNKWYRKCSIKTKPRHDVRLYWVDTSEYEDGGDQLVNKGYERDQKNMESKCKHSKN